MQRAAQRLKQAGAGGAAKRPANSAGGSRHRKRDTGPRPSDDELAAFYAEIVNFEEFLPPSMISTAMCHAMLDRRMVTPERLRERGVR